MPESTRAIAEKSIEEIAGEVLTFSRCGPIQPDGVAPFVTNVLRARIVEALRQRDERAAKIAETHSATDCDGPDCGVVVAAATRRSDSAGG
jgi:hypothetical protein